jgi:hypothetical protein
MTRSRPPQRGQERTSRSNARAINAAQVRARVGAGGAGAGVECLRVRVGRWLAVAGCIFFGARVRAEAAGLTPCTDYRPDLHPLAT